MNTARWQWTVPDEPGYWIDRFRSEVSECWHDPEDNELVIQSEYDKEPRPVSSLVKSFWLKLPPLPDDPA